MSYPIAELLNKILTPEHQEILSIELEKIIQHGYGEITIRIEGDKIFILPALSIRGIAKLFVANPENGL